MAILDYINQLSTDRREITEDKIIRVIDFLKQYGYLERIGDLTVREIIDAVKRLQKMYKLSEDGEIGHDVIYAIDQPRCGNSDVQSISESLYQWNKKNLSYKINGWVKTLDQSEQRAIIRQAWYQWEKVCGITVMETRSNSADVIIGVGTGSKYQFDGPGKTLAWAQLPASSRDAQLIMMYDGDENWSSTPARGIDMATVTVHELGHILGLDHSTVGTAIMAPTYNPRVNIPQNNDDVQRAFTRYGKSVASVSPDDYKLV